MAYISPFPALRYNPEKVSVGSCVTQPYDKITSQMQDAYYARSQYNLVRIILGKREDPDNSKVNVYTRAAGFFRDWRRDGIYLQDAEPSIYTYAQRFTAPGSAERLERRGFIALGRLEDYSAGVVYRHEQTLAKPKADRLDLLRATRAHFGQLFMLYSDTGEIDRLLHSNDSPVIEVKDEYDVEHRVWRISDKTVLDQVREKMADKALIIADGHHRYETALNYRNERRAAEASDSRLGMGGGVLTSTLLASDVALAPYELVMMTFVNMNSPALLVLPTHRVVHGVAGFSSEGLRSGASKFFSVEEVDAGVDASRATGILRQAGQIGTALLAVTRDRVFLLHSPKMVDSELFRGQSQRQQSLDVVQLHKGILEGALAISEEAIRDQKNIRYIRDAAEAMAQVHRGDADVAFLMNPVRMEQVRDIALANEVLPQKSTDFYPKLLSGLTIYALE